MAEAVQLMHDLSRSPEFLHLETMREMSRLDEGHLAPTDAVVGGVLAGRGQGRPRVGVLHRNACHYGNLTR